MPQAYPELQQEWGPDDSKAWKYLKEKGWKTKGFIMIHPYSKIDDIPEKEYRAALYLFQEWDWGIKNDWSRNIRYSRQASAYTEG